MIAEIIDGTSELPEGAVYILDDTLSLGFTTDEFVLRGGDEDVVAAITNAAVGCMAG
jgi:hypothetical protein